VLGAALLGLDRLYDGMTPSSIATRIRRELEEWRPARAGE
jgi:hypothetical protein